MLSDLDKEKIEIDRREKINRLLKIMGWLVLLLFLFVVMGVLGVLFVANDEQAVLNLKVFFNESKAVWFGFRIFIFAAVVLFWEKIGRLFKLDLYRWNKIKLVTIVSYVVYEFILALQDTFSG